MLAQTISSKSSNLSSGGGPKTQICKTLAVLISVATPNPGATPLVLTPPRRRPPLLLPHYPCRPAAPPSTPCYPSPPPPTSFHHDAPHHCRTITLPPSTPRRFPPHPRPSTPSSLLPVYSTPWTSLPLVWYKFSFFSCN